MYRFAGTENQGVKKKHLEALQEKHGDKPQAILQSNTMFESHDTVTLLGKIAMLCACTHMQMVPVVKYPCWSGLYEASCVAFCIPYV